MIDNRIFLLGLTSD